MSILTSGPIFRAISPQLTHRATPVPANGCAPRPPAGTDIVVRVDDGRAMIPTPAQLERYAREMQQSRGGAAPKRATSQQVCTSTFTPSAPGQRYQMQAPEVRAQWDRMGQSTASLRSEAQELGKKLTVAILRGDGSQVAKLMMKLHQIGETLKGRGVPNEPTDLTAATKYGGAVKKMSNEALNKEWTLQSTRAAIAEFRGDKAGLADAKKKLEACHTEVKSRVDNQLAAYMKELEAMSDAEVAEANGEAMDGVDGADDCDDVDGVDGVDDADDGDDEVADAQTPGATTQLPPPGPTEAPKGDDFEKMIASAAELVKRGLEESLSAPLKFIGGLFGF